MSRIVLFSIDVIGEKMAGPGIRYWEMAKALSKEHQVTLVCPNQEGLPVANFTLVSTRGFFATSNPLAGFDVAIGQRLDQYITQLKKHKVAIVADLYAPPIIEGLEYLHDGKQGDAAYAVYRHRTELMLRWADHIVCASRAQRALYIGMLVALGRIDPPQYLSDKTLSNLISIVPFGLPEQLPVHTKQVLKGVVPGIELSDKVILWGGGIWNWFDPLTLIRAIDVLSRQRSDIKLFFLGGKHPSPEVPEMQMAYQAQQLAKQLNLDERFVFFNHDWVDYDQRANYLLESDLSAVLTEASLENDFSFRTRVLDCFWAGLPVVINDGSSLSDVIARYGVGKTIVEPTPEKLAAVIDQILQPGQLETMRDNMDMVRLQFIWPQALSELTDYLERQHSLPHANLNFKQRSKLWSFQMRGWARRFEYARAELGWRQSLVRAKGKLKL